MRRTKFAPVLIAICLFPGCNEKPNSAITPSANDPWPECKAIREWLSIHAHDPASVEIVEWKERRLESGPPNVYLVRVRIRGKTRRGALSNFLDAFRVSADGGIEAINSNDPDCCHD